MKPRAFNSISINYQQNYLTKSSCDSLKLKDEVNYYLELPDHIAKFFPQLIGYSRDFSSYTMEYLPHADLSHLLLHNEITFSEGKEVLKTLLGMLDKLHKNVYLSNLTPFDINDFYIEKTITRLHKLKSLENFKDLLNFPSIRINGKIYNNFQHYQARFNKSFREFIALYPEISIIHGDFCFGNILYCLTTKDIKLIDPRGSFGLTGIYGHPYYDYAKLLHCLHGKYDLIVNNQYELTEIGEKEFIFHIFKSPIIDDLFQYFKLFLREKNIDLQFLYLIEASLFLSMAALHYEDPHRQKALFFTGIMILNDFYEGKYENLH